MLTGNDLLTLVNEMQAQEPPAKMSEIVRACGYEIDAYVQEYVLHPTHPFPHHLDVL
jgi:hypothetical protein